MALVKFDSESFIAALEPGVCSYVMQQFKDRLETKLNRIVEETYWELEKELPSKIKAKILQAFLPHTDALQVNVEVDIRQPEIEE